MMMTWHLLCLDHLDDDDHADDQADHDEDEDVTVCTPRPPRQ